LYVNKVLVDSKSQVGSIDTNSADIGIFASPIGNSPIQPNDALSWLSLIHGFVDQTWVNNDYNGIRDLSEIDEILAFPFIQDVKPRPPFTSGTFRSHTP